MKRDEDLFLDGGDTAMTQLVGRYERPLFHFLSQMVGDSHLAEDIFQETFLRLHRSRASYQSNQPLKPYLYRIAINLTRDALARRAARLETVSLEQSQSGVADSNLAPRDTIPGNAPDPIEDLQQSELKASVRAAVARLPQTEREVVILRIFEGLSFNEIAIAMEAPVPTVKSRMLYALRRLRPILECYRPAISSVQNLNQIAQEKRSLDHS